MTSPGFRSTRLLRTLVLAIVLAGVVGATSAAAQDDEPIPYPGQEQPRTRRPDKLRELPPTSSEDPARDYSEVAVTEDVENYSSLDDHNRGFGGEAIIGMMFLDASSGAFADLRPGFGARFVWEFGRTIGGERLRERLFADFSWLRVTLNGGTQQVQSQFGIHALSVAPAFNFLVNESNTLAGYVQAGGGVALQSSALIVDGTTWSVSALKPLIQYGLGLRGRPQLSNSSPLRITYRVELTRFRRDYFDDLFIGASVGLVF